MSDIPEPNLPRPRWVRLPNKISGICETDLAFLKVDFEPTIGLSAIPGPDRLFLGHEVVSEVLEVGPDVTRFDIDIGDRTVMAYAPFQSANCLILGDRTSMLVMHER